MTIKQLLEHPPQAVSQSTATHEAVTDGNLCECSVCFSISVLSNTLKWNFTIFTFKLFWPMWSLFAVQQNFDHRQAWSFVFSARNSSNNFQNGQRPAKNFNSNWLLEVAEFNFRIPWLSNIACVEYQILLFWKNSLHLYDIYIAIIYQHGGLWQTANEYCGVS